jgi:hypothetical protein
VILCPEPVERHTRSCALSLVILCPEPVERARTGKRRRLIHNLRPISCRFHERISMIRGCRGSTFFVAPTIRSMSAVLVILNIDCSHMRPVVGTRIRGVVDRWRSLGLKNVSTLRMRTCWSTRSRNGDVRKARVDQRSLRRSAAVIALRVTQASCRRGALERSLCPSTGSGHISTGSGHISESESHVEPELDDVPVSHQVVLAFQPHFALSTCVLH